MLTINGDKFDKMSEIHQSMSVLKSLFHDLTVVLQKLRKNRIKIKISNLWVNGVQEEGGCG
jgi:hypothetical protein